MIQIHPYKPFGITCTDDSSTIRPRTILIFKAYVHTEPKRRFRAQGQTDHKASSTDRGHRTSLPMITTSTGDLISNFLIHTKQTELYRSSLYLHSSPPCPWLSFRLDSGQQQQTQRVSFHQALFGLCLSH